MRLVLVVPAFPRLSESFIVSKFLGLLDRGWDVHVVCHQSEAREWGRFPALQGHDEARRRVHRVWRTDPRWLMPLRWPMALLGAARHPMRLSRYVRRGRGADALSRLRNAYLDSTLIGLGPDSVHFEFGALAVGRTHLRRQLGVRLTCSFRGYDLNFSGLEVPGYYDAVWREVDAIHCLGQDLWHRALHRGCPPAKPHVLIPPALDPGIWTPPDDRGGERLGTRERPIRLLSVGRLEWKKGYEFNLEVVHRLVRAGLACEYRIVGGGSHLEAVAFERKQMNLDSEVTLLGPQPAERVRRELVWADVFLHGAVSEGFCNGAIEAQAMRLPVVCSDADGLGENVADGETGFVLPRRDPGAMAEAVRRLAEDPDLRLRMGRAGRTRVEQRFRIEDQLEAFDRFHRGPAGEEGLRARVDDYGGSVHPS
ncbi:MAG: glycosyltransferase family 4 protein [Verrucomicrobiae bacterium]|nr:glycosyltransferase family 4 protein [Verrucomicrobiae bacterium]